MAYATESGVDSHFFAEIKKDELCLAVKEGNWQKVKHFMMGQQDLWWDLDTNGPKVFYYDLLSVAKEAFSVEMNQPIHMIKWRNVKSLVTTFPDLCWELDNNGRTALHCVTIANAPMKVLRVVVEQDCEALYHFDNDGFRPSYYARIAERDERVIRFLDGYWCGSSENFQIQHVSWLEWDEYYWKTRRLLWGDPSLEKIVLEECNIQWPSIEEEIVMDVMDGISSHPSIHSIDLGLSFDFLGYHGFDGIDACFKQAFRLNSSIREMSVVVTKYRPLPDIVDLAQCCRQLETLSIKNQYDPPTREQLDAFTSGVSSQLTVLRSLTLPGNFLTVTESMATLATIFLPSCPIRELSFSNYRPVPWGNDGVVAFVNSLPKDHSLETIDFGHVPLDDGETMTTLSRLCSTQIKKVDIHCDLTEEGAGRIEAFMKRTLAHSLVDLHLRQPWVNTPAINNWRRELTIKAEKWTWTNRLLHLKKHGLTNW